MRSIFSFVSARKLLIHLSLIALTTVLIIAGTLWWLRHYTHHGEAIAVPDLSGKSLHELDDALRTTTLTFEITDSIYSDAQPRGAVISQNPPAGMMVKENRTIFLTVNSLLPEMVIMPDLNGKSRRIAIPMLEISGLKLEAAKYIPDESCTDCVVEQLYKGKAIEAGERIRKGEKITLMIGKQSNEMVIVPNLIGLSYMQSIDLINEYRLNAGVVLACEGCFTAQDSAMARVVSQLPDPGVRVPLGSFADLYLSTDTMSGNTFVLPVDTSDYENR